MAAADDKPAEEPAAPAEEPAAEEPAAAAEVSCRAGADSSASRALRASVCVFGCAALHGRCYMCTWTMNCLFCLPLLWG